MLPVRHLGPIRPHQPRGVHRPRPDRRRHPRKDVALGPLSADNGLSRRTIISTLHVGRRTVADKTTLALASADPPERKKIHRESAALNGLHAHIDAMIDEDPAIGTAAIWQRLADDYKTTVAYYTLRTYVVSRRATRKPPAESS